MADSPYSISILNREARQFRVLGLHRGLHHDEIVCSLEVRNINRPGEYEALSYAWGDPASRGIISVNGLPMAITTSLKEALRHLRLERSERYLWVDALCINQMDDEERSYQVEQMRSIYASASNVLVWLGPALHNSNAGIELIEKMAHHFTDYKPGEVVPAAIPASSEALLAIHKLLSRSYWSRMWIVQEVAVASRNPIVGCGHMWLEWSYWHAGIRFMRAHHERYFIQMCEDGTIFRDAQSNLRYRYNRFLNLDRTCRYFRSEMKETTKLVVLPPNDERTNFNHLLAMTRNQVATDSRDRIFALLGLVKRKDNEELIRPNIIPDYSKSVRFIYCETVRMWIELEGTLEILQFKNHISPPGFPSWTPDFAAVAQYPPLGPDIWYDWSASGRLRSPSGSPLCAISEDLNILHAKGSIIDEISQVVDLNSLEQDPIRTIQAIHHSVFPLDDRAVSMPSFRYLTEAVWRSLVGNRSAENIYPCPWVYGELYLHLVNRTTLRAQDSQYKQTPEPSEFLKAMGSAISYWPSSPHRKFIQSLGGIIGLGTPDCEIGDLLCILRGYKMPVILRRIDYYYVFLGSVYLHGFMHGEALADVEYREIEFTIR